MDRIATDWLNIPSGGLECKPSWDDWERFKKLSAREQRYVYEQFEQRVGRWMDDFYRQKLGATTVDRGDSDIYKDLVLTLGNGGKIRIEEKFRSKVWDDCAIELLQDITPPFNTHKLGWFSICRSDRVFYVMCPSLVSAAPAVIYSLNMTKIKNGGLQQLLRVHPEYCQSMVSHKGQQLSINLLLPWDKLVAAQLAVQLK